MVTVTVKTPGKPSIQVEFPQKNVNQIKVSELKNGIHAKFPKLTPVRQRLTLPLPSSETSNNTKAPTKPTVLAEDTHTLADYGIKDSGSEIRCKDLGPQIAWRTVFLAEYAGPIFIQPLLYHLAKNGQSLYGTLHSLGLKFLAKDGPYTPSMLQKTVLALTILHYVKREYETLFVHKFSHATMPVRNILKNCSHYWLLCGVMTASSLYRPRYSAEALSGTIFDNPAWIAAWAAVWVFGEFSNYLTHVNLRSIRTPPGQPRKFPRGYGFDLVTCANYFFESVSWIALSVMTFDGAMILFTAVSFSQMAEWAVKKHKTYRKEHGEKYPRGRKIMIPFVW